MIKYRGILVAAVIGGFAFVSLPALAVGDPGLCGFTGGDPAHGKKTFENICSACHGMDGHGAIPGTPDFTKKGGVLSKPHADLADHIRNGFAPPGASMVMPPKGGDPELSDQDIKDVHAYLHQKFGCGK